MHGRVWVVVAHPLALSAVNLDSTSPAGDAAVAITSVLVIFLQLCALVMSAFVCSLGKIEKVVTLQYHTVTGDSAASQSQLACMASAATITYSL